jgi:putative peptidoglycan lipid II flippase
VNQARGGSGLLRSSAVVALGTGLSRATGLLRIMAIAYALGTTMAADAYNLANNTPNLIYDLVLGGILAATLVPVVVDRNAQNDARGVDALATVITLVLIGLTIVATLAAPLIIRIYTLDLDPAEAERQTSLALPLLFMFMPQVLFYGLATLWTALLNARRSFAAPAFAPVLNNVVVIAVFLALARVVTSAPTVEEIRDDTALLVLIGLGTTAGIVAMTLVLWPAMRRAGIRLHWNPDWRDPAVRTVARLSGWTLGYVVANQIVFLITIVLANGVGDGAVAAYTYAWLFFQLPYGLFTVSIMTTFTPELASLAVRGDLADYRARFSQGLRLGNFVILPAAGLYVALAAPIVGLLLERGAFTEASSDLVAPALAWFALGLPGFAAFLLTMRGFYAFKDTRTPFWLNLGENGVQVVLALALVGPFGLEGVIAAFSIAYSVAAVAAVLVLRAKVGGLDGKRLGAALVRQATAVLAMVVAVVGLTRLVGGDDQTSYLVEAIGGAVLGAAVYLGVLALLRSQDLQELRSQLRRGAAGPDTAPMS